MHFLQLNELVLSFLKLLLNLLNLSPLQLLLTLVLYYHLSLILLLEFVQQFLFLLHVLLDSFLKTLYVYFLSIFNFALFILTSINHRVSFVLDLF